MPVINIEENLFVCPFTPRASPTERPRVPEVGAEPGRLPGPACWAGAGHLSPCQGEEQWSVTGPAPRSLPTGGTLMTARSRTALPFKLVEGKAVGWPAGPGNS